MVSHLASEVKPRRPPGGALIAKQDEAVLRRLEAHLVRLRVRVRVRVRSGLG